MEVGNYTVVVKNWKYIPPLELEKIAQKYKNGDAAVQAKYSKYSLSNEVEYSITTYAWQKLAKVWARN